MPGYSEPQQPIPMRRDCCSASQVQKLRPREGEPVPKVTELGTQRQDENSCGLDSELSLSI